MIDLHTHILCGVDDGAPDEETSLQMLRMEQTQGVDTVVLTPHFYRYRETPEEFLCRRKEALGRLQAHLDRLPEEEQAGLPRLLTGAEVAWVPNLQECELLEQMCLNGTEFLLLELPYMKWDGTLVEQIYDLMTKTGLTPVLAHLDRYRGLQKPERIREMMDLDVPVQVSAEAFLHMSTKGYGMKLLRECAPVLASDCHNTASRKPDLGDAMAVIGKKLGPQLVSAIDEEARSLVGLG